MKTRLFTLFLGTFAIMISGKAIAQDTNPYSVFGFKIDGGISTSAENYTPPVQYVEIENPDETSPVARLRFFPKTNMAQFLGKNAEVLYEEHWKDNQYKWLTMDRKAEKYYSISPYAYCANNPVRYIDPTGEIIQVYDFANDQMNSYQWRQYEGTWGFYNNDNSMYAGENTFINQLTGALNGLMNGGSTGFDLVSGLANNSNVVTLMYSNNSAADHQNQLGWNPTGLKRDGSLEAVPTTAGMRSDPMITLGHELGHVQDNWSGNQHGTWFTMATEKGNRNISTSEIVTTHIENQLRSEQGLPLRTHYGTQDNYGYGPRTIVPSTGASRYYNSDGMTNYQPLKRGVSPYVYGR